MFSNDDLYGSNRKSWSKSKPRLEAMLPMSSDNPHRLRTTFLFKVEDNKRPSVKMLADYIDSETKTANSTTQISPKSLQMCKPTYYINC